MAQHIGSGRPVTKAFKSKQQRAHLDELAHEKGNRPAAHEASHQPSPQQQLPAMITGYWISASIYAAAKLGIGDLLKHGPQTAQWLAEKTGTQGRPLYRLLRALASVGIFAEDENHRFALTPLAELLRSDVPGSQRAFALFMGEEIYQSFGDLLGSLRTGGSAYERLCGRKPFEYLQQHPEKAAIFDEAMTSIHGRETAAMLEAYGFSGVRVLADLGGGNGSLLCATLQRYPQMQGILCDLPGVVERARPIIEAAGLSGRCRLVAGNFFESVPGGADAYLMRHIIHDWDDEQAAVILRNTRQAMHGGSRLLLVENVIEPGNAPALGKLLDVVMLVAPGGQERTEEEYRRLYEQAGFRLTGIVPTGADVSVIEGEPA